MKQLKTGIVSDAYLPYHNSLKESYELMKEHGYDCLDAQYFLNTETELFEVSDAEFEKRLIQRKALVESCGLCFSQTHGPWRWPARDYTEEDLRERYSVMKKAIRGTAYLGAPICVIHCIMPFGPDNPDHARELLDMNAEFFGNLCEEAKKYNIIIGFENLPFLHLPLSRTDHIVEFVKMMNNDNMRICFDTGHCAVYGMSVGDAVRTIGKDLLCCLHVHDNDGHKDLHRPLGEGVIDWADFAKALQDIDYDGVVSLETSISKADSMEERDILERRLADNAKRIACGENIVVD